jgi:cytochrome c biogenesis protein CcmG, thiol:disulfide interchange protein DsbE
MLIVPIITFGQSNYYKLQNGIIYNDHDFNLYFRSMIKALPKEYSLTPIIYHKSEIKDSVINYVQFQKIWWGDKKIDPSKFDIVYKQDTLLLFLDKKLPEFRLKDLNGKTFNPSQLIGKPTLINFWGINCRGCIEEIPQLDKLKEKYKGNVNFVAICTDAYPSDSIKVFLYKRPFNFYHLVGGFDYCFKTLKISGIPVNMFLDKNGYVREIKNIMPLGSNKFTGNTEDFPELNNEEFAKILETLLKL